jgi:DNA-binding NarL/FixJ family response regulator
MTTNATDNAPETAPPPEGLIDVAVLDDDQDFLSYMEDFLRDEGQYTVRTFTHPEALFAQAAERRPDIVLLDMKMGDVRGDSVLEQLQARFPGLCVIVVTGYPSLEDMRATFKLKVFDYLPKPFTGPDSPGAGQRGGGLSASAARCRTVCARNSATASACCAPSTTGRSRIWPKPRA